MARSNAPKRSTRRAARPEAPSAARPAAPPEEQAVVESDDADARPDDVAPTDGCPVVGIGASAGGLEALHEFLTSLGTDTGMAYVVVQHLAPSHDSMLSEILSRAT